MNKRKETAAKILTLLGGLKFKEINQILDDVKEEMENAKWVPSPDLIVTETNTKESSACMAEQSA